MRKLENATDLKKTLKAKALACVETDEILEVIIAAENQTSIKYKPRSSHES
jgi:hypothetical protein